MIVASLVLDASPILNVLGTGYPAVVLAPFAGVCIVEERTIKEVQRNPFDGGLAQPAIERLVSAGHLRVARMGDSAYEEYLALVGAPTPESLGSGESAALALASEIRSTVVLDDRKARRIGMAKYRNCEQWTSARLFREAFAAGGVPRNKAIEMTRNALSLARMHVSIEDREWLGQLGL